MCGSPVPADRKAVCDMLATLREEPLPFDAWGVAGMPVARVTIMPAGQPVLAIRVIGGRMSVRRIDHGKIDIDRVVSLSDGERLTLLHVGTVAWGSIGENADAPTFAPCKAPNYIAVEANINRVAKFAVSHCVALKPLRDLADAYLNIAGERVPELKQDLEQSLD
jgi:hypothetical protein